jgi:hypothetical protein
MLNAAVHVSKDDFPLHMSPAEAALLNELMQTARFYLEWGSGGSTLAAARSNIEQIVSVETDAAWIERLKQHQEIASAVSVNRLTFRHVDIGPVGQWGVPVGESKIRTWPQYALDPFVSTDFDYDLILIDGRFRNHCLLAVVNCVSNKSLIFLHDYTFRYSYTIADKYFDTIKHVDTVVLLKKRSHINYRSLYIDLINSLFNI